MGLNAIKQINDAIKAEFSNKKVSAIDGIAKQQMNGNDGLRLMIYSDAKEPDLFVPDSDYDLQIAHLRNGGRSVNSSANPFKKLWTSEIDMIIISKQVKFYHILSILNKNITELNHVNFIFHFPMQISQSLIMSRFVSLLFQNILTELNLVEFL